LKLFTDKVEVTGKDGDAIKFSQEQLSALTPEQLTALEAIGATKV
jgi:hypothetical protein